MTPFRYCSMVNFAQIDELGRLHWVPSHRCCLLARFRHADGLREWPLMGEDRKRPANGQTDANARSGHCPNGHIALEILKNGCTRCCLAIHLVVAAPSRSSTAFFEADIRRICIARKTIKAGEL
jgi:hypothetical protein